MAVKELKSNATWILKLQSLDLDHHMKSTRLKIRNLSPRLDHDPEYRIESFVLAKDTAVGGMAYASEKFKEARASLLNALN